MNKTKGIALVILSAVIFGITPTMAKYTYTHGSNPVMMTMFRSLLPIPIILAFLLFKKIPIKIPAKTLGKISIIALIGSTVTSVMLNMSYNYIPVGMPYCAGYACGYYMVKYYLDKTGKDIVDATILPAEEILKEIDGFWSETTIIRKGNSYEDSK